MQLIASRRHTAIVIAILAFLAIGGYSANVNRKPKQPPNRPVLYVSVIIGQLLLTYYVKIGLRGVTIRDLIAPRACGQAPTARSDCLRGLRKLSANDPPLPFGGGASMFLAPHRSRRGAGIL